MADPVDAPRENVFQLVQAKRERHRRINIRLAATVDDMPKALGVVGAMLDRQSTADVSLYLTILPS